MSARHVLVTAVGCVLLAPAAGALAQQRPPPPRVTASQSVQQALAAYEAGAFQNARLMLERALADCAADDEPARCRGLVAHSLAYLHDSAWQRERTRADTLADDSLFDAARRYYELALAEDPERGDIVYNMALLYREHGAHEWQESFFLRAAALDPARRDTYLVLLGDYYRDQQRWTDAIDRYAEALGSTTNGDAARTGMVEAIRALADREPDRGWTRRLLDLGVEWEPDFPVPADRAYSSVLELATAGVAADADVLPAIAEEALLLRVALHARQRRVGPATLAHVSQQWSAVTELLDYLAADEPVPAGRWWTLSEPRRRVLARVAWARGSAQLVHSELDRAEAWWRAALELVPPTFAEALDVKRELALLWFHHPELDPDGRKFAALEQDLFLEKADVLAARNLEAAQRYHTTLGLIYAENGVWRSAQPGRNATQQLRWALETAAERDTLEGLYQPLPELHDRLAQGLETQALLRAAATSYGMAALGFLDTDQLEDAARAARNAVRVESRAPDATVPFAELIAFRRSLEGLRAAPAATAAALCERGAIARAVRSADGADLPAPMHFPRRQTLKALADCAEYGPAALRVPYSVEVVDLVRAGVPLVGIADRLRYERAAASVRASGRPHT